MGLMNQLSEGVAKVASEAQKVIEQGKGKVEELQLERQMDVAARKLGYLELDRSRGRSADEGARQDLLQQLATLEDQLVAAQNAKKAAEAKATEAASAPADATTSAAPGTSAPDAEAPTQPPSAAGD